MTEHPGKPIRARMAEYHTPEDPDEAGNPYLEALPPVWTRAEIMEGITRYLPHAEHLRRARPEVRMVALLKLKHYFQPSLRDLDLALDIFGHIRAGYLNRNPVGANFVSTLKRGIAALADGGNDLDPEATANGILKVGVSGVGKTVTARVVLECMPRVIVHKAYRGKRFHKTQIVWIKVNCPKKGGVLKLCKDIISQVDRILGESYWRKHSLRRISIEDAELALVGIANAHGLGILVIDEVQNLKRATPNERAVTLTFLTSLMNGLGVPVLFIGTKDAYPIMKGAFPPARRTAGNFHAFNRFALDDTFSLFVEGFWDYQLVDDPVEFDPRPQDDSERLRGVPAAWASLFYHYSQGVADIAVKLYIETQRHAISLAMRGGRSTITPKLVAEVWDTRFKLLHEHVEAIRGGLEPVEPAFGDALVSLDGMIEAAVRGEAGEDTTDGAKRDISVADGTNELPDGYEQDDWNDGNPELSDDLDNYAKAPPSKKAKARILGAPATEAALRRAASIPTKSRLDQIVAAGQRGGIKPTEAIATKRNSSTASGSKHRPGSTG